MNVARLVAESVIPEIEETRRTIDRLLADLRRESERLVLLEQVAAVARMADREEGA